MQTRTMYERATHAFLKMSSISARTASVFGSLFLSIEAYDQTLDINYYATDRERV